MKGSRHPNIAWIIGIYYHLFALGGLPYKKDGGYSSSLSGVPPRVFNFKIGSLRSYNGDAEENVD